MKIKQAVWISDPVGFIKYGSDSSGLSMTSTGMDMTKMGWVRACDIELDFDAKALGLYETASEAIDRKEQEIKEQAAKALDMLKNERAALLALTHGGGE